MQVGLITRFGVLDEAVMEVVNMMELNDKSKRTRDIDSADCVPCDLGVVLDVRFSVQHPHIWGCTDRILSNVRVSKHYT